MKKVNEFFDRLFESLYRIIKDSSLGPFFSAIIAVLTIVLANKFVFVDKLFSTEFSPEKSLIFKIILFVLVFAVFLLPYLTKFLYQSRDYDDDIPRFNKKYNFDIDINDILKYKSTSTDDNKIDVEEIEDSLLKKLSQKYDKELKLDYIKNVINNELVPLTENAKKHIDTIQRNSIVNLIIGIIGTIISISILAISIFSEKTYTDPIIFLIHFAPRVTFVIFIQLFAFFFLRLYKSNLEDAKYFQNELTNLQAKSSSLKISYLTKNESFSEILREISLTERNFKILKEESLLNLEKAKIDRDIDLETINTFKNFLAYFKKSRDSEEK